MSKENGESDSKRTLEDHLSRSLTKGASVKASGEHGDYSAEQALDGMSEDSRWIVKGPGSLEVDLGRKDFPQRLPCLRMEAEARYAVKNFELQVKNEGLGNRAGRKNSKQFRRIIPSPFGRTGESTVASLVFKDDDFNRVYEVAVFEGQPRIAEQEASALHHPRVCREVATERDLFNFGGTFYELPARNAQGFAKIRPVATHNLKIHDYASHFGLLFMTGLTGEKGERIVQARMEKTRFGQALSMTFGSGKTRGKGGVWKDSKVKAGVPPSLPDDRL